MSRDQARVAIKRQSTKLTKVLIGIQARSTSTRLPGKCFAKVGDKMLLEHVYDACQNAARYVNGYSMKHGASVSVALLIPTGDEIEKQFKNCIIVTGPESDVLSRYQKAAIAFDADFIVRVTGDCPLIPPFLISKHIILAVERCYDYVSNAYGDNRTALDGIDCEVISRRLLDHCAKEATESFDREHVTTFAKSNPPDWAKMGCVIGFFDQSAIKLSVDTKEDLERVRIEYEAVSKHVAAAERQFGKQSVHRM